MAKRKRYYPLPEAIPARTGGDPDTGPQWTINDAPAGTARTDVSGQRMDVPLGDDDLARNHRRREMGRAAWSPVQSPAQLAREHGVSPEALQHVETMRINSGLRWATALPLDGPGMHSDDDIAYTTKAIANIADTDPKRAFRLASYELLAAKHTGSYDRMAAGLAGTRVERATRVVEAVWRRMAEGQGYEYHVLPFERTIEGAKYLDEILGAADQYFEGDPDTTEALQELVPESPGTPKEAAPENGKDDTQFNELLNKLPAWALRGTTNPQWGIMTIDQPPRKQVRHERKIAKRNRSSDFGVVPKYVHRACSDGRVFGYKRKQRGGAVLIDGSGSMSITPSDVKRLVEIAPQSLVAIYSGNREGNGVLRVLARKGQMVDADKMCPPSGGNNCIDGPALDWLVAQRQRPMVWVSDGMVTGNKETGFNTVLALQCEALCRKKRITRVLSVREAITYFEQYHKPGRRERPE